MNAAIDLDFSISGKVAVITGGASGIGAAIARGFAAKGVTVAIVDLNLAAAQAVAAELGAEHRGFACNVADPASVESMAAAVSKEYGRVDILVNSAGIAALDPAESISFDYWQRTLDVNLTGTFLVCQAIGRLMKAAGSGKIINLCSQAGTVAIRDHVAYCASKFGVLGVTKVLALEWGGFGINVNSISPTVVLTDLGRKAWAGPKGDAHKAQIPKGRFAEPEEIAAAAVFLASPGSDMVNGADLLVDGGFTIA